MRRGLGLGSQQTAWIMLHHFRHAMVRPGRDQLKGRVEADETYLDVTDKPPASASRKRKSNTVDLIQWHAHRTNPIGGVDDGHVRE